MNEETTRELTDRASFEQRVFARFDSIDARFNAVDVRFDGVEARLEKLESHSYDTKPIWERALKEILETQLELVGLKSKVEGIEMKIEQLAESQRDFKVKITRRIDPVLEVMIDNRDSWRNSDARLSQLESKLA